MRIYDASHPIHNQTNQTNARRPQMNRNQATRPTLEGQTPRPATERQISWLKNMAEEIAQAAQGDFATDNHTVSAAQIMAVALSDEHVGKITTRSASAMIDAAQVEIKRIRAAARSKKPAVEVPEGFYIKDGEAIKVQVAVHGSGRPYAKRLVLVLGEDGKAVADGRWEYAPGLVSLLRPEHKLTKEQAIEFGQLYGVCGVCGAILTNETSIELGIGPICGKRF